MSLSLSCVIWSHSVPIWSYPSRSLTLRSDAPAELPVELLLRLRAFNSLAKLSDLGAQLLELRCRHFTHKRLLRPDGALVGFPAEPLAGVRLFAH